MATTNRFEIQLLLFSVIAQLLVWACFSHIFGQIEAQGNWQYWILTLALLLLGSGALFYLKDRRMQLLAMIFLAGLAAGSLLHATGLYANPVFNLPVWMRILTILLTGMALLLVFIKAKKQYAFWVLVMIGLNFLFTGINMFCDYNLINFVKSLL